jgi:hypothetical protein
LSDCRWRGGHEIRTPQLMPDGAQATIRTLVDAGVADVLDKPGYL